MEKVQKICVAGLLFHQGKVLILKRSMKETFLPGFWDIPGGKIKFGEMPEEALKREVREETGLNIEPIKPFHLFSYVSKKGQWHCVDIQYIMVAKSNINTIKLSGDHDEYKWITKKELGQYFSISDEMKKTLLAGFEEVKNNL